LINSTTVVNGNGLSDLSTATLITSNGLSVFTFSVKLNLQYMVI